MTRIAAWAAVVVLAAWGSLRGIEEAVRIYIELATA